MRTSWRTPNSPSLRAGRSPAGPSSRSVGERWSTKGAGFWQRRAAANWRPGSIGRDHSYEPESSVAECVRTLKQGRRLALSWWDDPSRQRIQGLFREAIAEVGAAPPHDVPAGYSILRFSDTDEFRRLLEGAGLTEVAVHDHR